MQPRDSVQYHFQCQAGAVAGAWLDPPHSVCSTPAKTKESDKPREPFARVRGCIAAGGFSSALGGVESVQILAPASMEIDTLLLPAGCSRLLLVGCLISGADCAVCQWERCEAQGRFLARQGGGHHGATRAWYHAGEKEFLDGWLPPPKKNSDRDVSAVSRLPQGGGGERGERRRRRRRKEGGMLRGCLPTGTAWGAAVCYHVYV